MTNERMKGKTYIGPIPYTGGLAQGITGITGMTRVMGVTGRTGVTSSNSYIRKGEEVTGYYEDKRTTGRNISYGIMFGLCLLGFVLTGSGWFVAGMVISFWKWL